ncbi:MAG: hypothetical protein M3Y48_13350 [Actinomycetota bacterium]|nr:hypothetical protein [Actinomycetota bacterium]
MLTNPAHAAEGKYDAIAYSQSTAIAAVGFAGNKNDAALSAVDQCRTQGGISMPNLVWFSRDDGEPRRTIRSAEHQVNAGAGQHLLLAVLAVLGVGLALLAARVQRHRAERRRWDGRIQVKPAPDPNPTIRVRELGSTASFAVRVEVHPDQGVQNVREVSPR